MFDEMTDQHEDPLMVNRAKNVWSRYAAWFVIGLAVGAAATYLAMNNGWVEIAHVTLPG